MEKKLWYAVQEDPTDDWGRGSYNKDEAIEMMMRNDQYNLIAVIENDCCVEEIYKSDL